MKGKGAGGRGGDEQVQALRQQAVAAAVAASKPRLQVATSVARAEEGGRAGGPCFFGGRSGWAGALAGRGRFDLGCVFRRFSTGVLL